MSIAGSNDTCLRSVRKFVFILESSDYFNEIENYEEWEKNFPDGCGERHIYMVRCWIEIYVLGESPLWINGGEQGYTRVVKYNWDENA